MNIGDLCRCGHSRDQHHRGFILAGGACFAMVDQRGLTAGGPLAPCDCKVFEPLNIGSARG